MLTGCVSFRMSRIRARQAKMDEAGLIRELKSRNRLRRGQAADRLGARRSAKAVPHLVELLDDKQFGEDLIMGGQRTVEQLASSAIKRTAAIREKIDLKDWYKKNKDRAQIDWLADALKSGKAYSYQTLRSNDAVVGLRFVTKKSFGFPVGGEEDTRQLVKKDVERRMQAVEKWTAWLKSDEADKFR